MKLAFLAGAAADLRCDLLAVPVFQGNLAEGDAFATLDKRLDGLLGRLTAEEHFQGKPGQQLSVHTHGRVGPQRILLVGVGERAKFDAAELRDAAARAARAARATGAKHVALALPAGPDRDRAAQLAAEGLLLGKYRFDRYLSEDGRRKDLVETGTVLHAGPNDGIDGLERVGRRAQVVAAAVARTRDLVNEPAAEMTPRRMAAEAERLATQHGLDVKILDRDGCRALGMGMFLAVAQGSDEEPRFIHLTYRPKTAARRRVCLVGKGVTFDSGGLSLKPSASMLDMKGDMAGAAAVLGAIGAVAELQLPLEVHAIAACTENMPSGKAYKLGDVLRSMSGTTVEINNTDAEGRLTLGDALTYARTLEPDELFDFATLTGACVVALGPHIAGVMTNNQPLAERWLAAAKTAGEDMWPLPLPDRLKEHLKSEIADMRNTGEREGGALSAGLFLREFAKDTPWVHVDLAGPASADKEHGATTKGGTGFGVATIVEFLAGRP